MKKSHILFVLGMLIFAYGCSATSDGGSTGSTPQNQQEVLNPSGNTVSSEVASAVTGYWLSDDPAGQQAVLYFNGSVVTAYDVQSGNLQTTRTGDYQLLTYTASNCSDCALVSIPCADGVRGSLLYFMNTGRTEMGFATNTAEGFYLGGTMVHTPSATFTFVGESADSLAAHGITLP